jgi:hypothetical protein
MRYPTNAKTTATNTSISIKNLLGTELLTQYPPLHFARNPQSEEAPQVLLTHTPPLQCVNGGQSVVVLQVLLVQEPFLHLELEPNVCWQ